MANPNTQRPRLGRTMSSGSSTMPLFPTGTGNTPHSASPSTSSFGPTTSFPGQPYPHSRVDSTTLSWIEPEDFDPTNLMDAPIPRPRSATGMAGTGHVPRTRSMSFGAASSLMGPNTPDPRSSASPSPFGLNPRDSRAGSALGLYDTNRVSLSINYAPSKFSDALATGGARRRRRANNSSGLGKEFGVMNGKLKRAPTLARGGGVDAQGWFDRTEQSGRWTRFKWILFVFNIIYTLLSLGALIITLLIHLNLISGSVVLLTANSTALTLSTLAASAALFTSVFGWAGVMLNNRSILAFYCLFLWVSFGLLVTPGYVTYKEYSLNLQGKLNFAWSEDFDVDARREIQNALGCCGYFSPFVEASISARCYARSVLPGCKGPFFQFEHKILYRWFTAVFSLAGFNIMIIVASLLCSNHVTYRFGKGMMPKRYQLTEEAVGIILSEWAGVVGEGYGDEAAERFIEANSRPGSRMHSRAASALDLHDTQQGGVDLSGMQMQELGAGTGTMESMGLTASSTAHSASASSIWGRPTTPSALAQTKYGTIGETRPDTAI
ncbi:Tetraspanin Tsp2 [Mycena sanguinolenta]|uniref:Tetraspanin Tsp2 n=1 Tax=Mycena sanguinolenta TaxID=230812 RepID=A0A8H6Z6H9_9AGAR|nr:Tetraspanin Tsp2 [Mycena sanguinolenta]